MQVNLSMPPSSIEKKTYEYLFGMAQQLNIALNALDESNLSPSVASALASGSKASSEVASLPSQYNTLRSMIIKTANTIRSEMDKLSVSLEGTYVAQSDFGSYVQELSSYIEANPEALTQYYKFASDLQANLDEVDVAFETYRTSTEGYIRTGIVYYEDEIPVYGVAVGQNLTSTTIDGEEVIDRRDFRATFTAKKLSFWQDETEVAYVSNNKLNIMEVDILNAMRIGNWDVSTSNGLAIKWVGD